MTAVESTQNGNLRGDMTKFWESHSNQASLEEMMLDTNASTLSKEELPEVLALLPELKGKKVLELGGGIGRFTGVIAEQANHVTTVDFMKSFIDKSKENNQKFTNIEYITADVTKLQMENGSYDVIFSNWLLMYLSDEEVRQLATKMLSWLKEGGFLFFRESCLHQSGNAKRQFNPSKYRSPELYNTLFQSVSVSGSGKDPWGFDLCFSQSLQSYIKLKNNRNQICWLMEKRQREVGENHGFATFQQFLDNKQYSKNSILRYEKVFGEGYVSTGGAKTTEEFVKMLDLKPGQKVLDVGCGIGGGDFYMSKLYKVDVLGVDLSGNMIEIAWERGRSQAELPVRFEVGDITKREYPLGSFDVVYSRDTILHIKDKLTLFKRFLTWLKPGGKLLISDYCCGEPPHSEEFKAYVKQRGYILYTPQQYGKLIEEAGFVNVKAEDRSQQFLDVLNSERNNLANNKQEFLKDFTEEDFNYLEDGWSSKLKRVGNKDQAWGLFYAEKAQ